MTRRPWTEQEIVADVAQVVVNSAKAEVEFMRTAGRITGTDFIPLTDQRADVEA